MKKSIPAFAVALSLLGAGTLVTANAQGLTQTGTQSNQTTSVAQNVKADLADWREAGFGGSDSYWLAQDAFGNAYQDRYAEYERLRDQRTNARN